MVANMKWHDAVDRMNSIMWKSMNSNACEIRFIWIHIGSCIHVGVQCCALWFEAVGNLLRKIADDVPVTTNDKTTSLQIGNVENENEGGGGEIDAHREQEWQS